MTRTVALRRTLPLFLLVAALAVVSCSPANPDPDRSPAATPGGTAAPAPAQEGGLDRVRHRQRFRGTIVGGRWYLIGRMRWSWRGPRSARAGC